MLSKITYVAQPYAVGPKERKSLAIIIPAKVTKEYDINPSTIFAIQIDKQSNNITLQRIDVPSQKDMIAAGQEFRGHRPEDINQNSK
jgi:bifunctional DNA-binding transcriptional regulator/antitoxin component of YhaV-PrlF toxin-antitoxin module